MSEFGELLRVNRRNSQDPERGGPLTQHTLRRTHWRLSGRYGLYGSGHQHWENGGPAQVRTSETGLIALLYVLHQAGGLNGRAEATICWPAGGYLALTENEARVGYCPGLMRGQRPFPSPPKLHPRLVTPAPLPSRFLI
jgi:hypothetical protein